MNTRSFYGILSALVLILALMGLVHNCYDFTSRKPLEFEPSENSRVWLALGGLALVGCGLWFGIFKKLLGNSSPKRTPSPPESPDLQPVGPVHLRDFKILNALGDLLISENPTLKVFVEPSDVDLSIENEMLLLRKELEDRKNTSGVENTSGVKDSLKQKEGDVSLPLLAAYRFLTSVLQGKPPFYKHLGVLRVREARFQLRSQLIARYHSAYTTYLNTPPLLRVPDGPDPCDMNWFYQLSQVTRVDLDQELETLTREWALVNKTIHHLGAVLRNVTFANLDLLCEDPRVINENSTHQDLTRSRINSQINHQREKELHRLYQYGLDFHFKRQARKNQHEEGAEYVRLMRLFKAQYEKRNCYKSVDLPAREIQRYNVTSSIVSREIQAIDIRGTLSTQNKQMQGFLLKCGKIISDIVQIELNLINSGWSLWCPKD